MSTGLNDNEIISKVLSGDHQAYAGLVNRYQSYVFTLTLRMVKSREDAEEVAQDVFIKAYKYLADFKGASKFTTWLYTIVNNTCISFLRKKKLDIHSLDNEKVFEVADSQDSGMRANMIEQKSKLAMVNDAINHPVLQSRTIAGRNGTDTGNRNKYCESPAT
jgi:RNA polymerase sigma factor (sigma-70 family)